MGICSSPFELRRQRSTRRLGHAIARDQRAAFAVNFNAGFSVACREAVEGLREQSGAEADQDQRRIFDADRREAAVLRKRGDRLRLVIKDEAQQIGVMNGEVEDRARARRGAVQPPTVQMLRQIASMNEPGGEGATNPARSGSFRASSSGSAPFRWW